MARIRTAGLAAFLLLALASGCSDPGGAPVAYDVLEDRSGTATIEEVTRPPLDREFRPADEPVLNLGLTSSTWWLRFDVPPQKLERGGPWLLELGWPLVDVAQLYSRGPTGRFSVQSAGRRVPVADWSLPYRSPTFRLSADGGGTYYLRVTGRETLILPVTLWNESAFASAHVTESTLLGFYFGMVFVMGASGLLVYLFLRDVGFLSYAGLVFTYALWQASFEGILSTYVWPDAWWWTGRALHVFGILCVLSGWVFARTFLGTQRHAPTADRVFVLGAPAFALLLAWALIVPGAAFVVTASIAAMLVGVWVIVAGAIVARTGSRSARYFLAAWAFVVVAALVQALRDLGFVESNVFTDYGMQVGFAFTFVTLSLGSVDRILGMRDDLDRSADDVRRLAREDAAKRTFLATASHDLRQPLHALGLLLGALRERLDDADSISLVQRIQSAANEMADMFNGLLDISRLDAGVVEPEAAPVDLADLFARLESELRAVATQKGIAIGANAEARAVETDAVLLSRILRNLLSNALRYTDEGEIRLMSRRAGPNVEIVVSDTGRGIPLSEQRAAFDAFRRLDGASEAAPAGLGLGLSIVRRLTDLLGHDLRLESAPGEGTTFTLTLPAASEAAPVPEAPVPRAAPSLQGLSILVLDDDASVREGMRQQLEAWGCVVHVARSAQEATDVDASLDLVLADYHLGEDGNGVQVIEAIRHRQEREVAAVVVTGDSSGVPAREAERVGVTILTKPVPPARLRTVLNRVARNASQGGV